MKNLFTLLLFSISFTCSAQWEQIGQDIYGGPNSLTGTSVSINDSGSIIALFDGVVNGDAGGQVRVFELQNDDWVQLGDPIPGFASTGETAGPIKLNGAGYRFIFGSPISDQNGVEISGVVRVFDYSGGSWIQVGQDLYGEEDGDYFGYSVDISLDGNDIIAGATQFGPTSGAPGYAKAYVLSGNNWIQKGSTIIGDSNFDHFGSSVTINNEGNIIGVTAPENDQNGDEAGQLKIFEFQNGMWNQLGNDILGDNPDDNLGEALSGGKAISFNGDGTLIAVGIPQENISGNSSSGLVKVYEFNNNNWTLKGNVIYGNSENEDFGFSLSLNESGNILYIGDPFGAFNFTGTLDAYRLSNNVWSVFGERIYGESDTNYLAVSVDCTNSGDSFITGAFGNDGNGTSSGVVRVYNDESILEIPNTQSNLSVLLAPNPNNGNFSLNFLEILDNASITISDVSGKLIFSESYNVLKNVEVAENFVSGIYFVKVKTNTSEATLKMIVQ